MTFNDLFINVCVFYLCYCLLVNKRMVCCLSDVICYPDFSGVVIYQELLRYRREGEEKAGLSPLFTN